MKATREVSIPIVDSIGNSSSSTMAPESPPEVLLCQYVFPPSTPTTANGGLPSLTTWASASSTPISSIWPALPSLPCNAITGRSFETWPAGPLWPGGRTITQLVCTPPRASETNEPVSLFDWVLLPAVAGSKGAGASGDGAARGSSGSSRALNAHTPTAPALAPAPIRSTARRFRSGTRVIMPRQQGLTATATPQLEGLCDSAVTHA